jgi:hypothetical protein
MPLTVRTWRILGIAYVLLFLAYSAIQRHGLKRGPMSPMELMLLAPIFWGLTVYCVQFGYVRGRFSRVERSDSPFTFWLNILFIAGVGFVSFGWGLHDSLN